MRRRIALLTNYPADHTTFRGGVETATAALLEGLRGYQDRFEFHVVSCPEGLTEDVAEESNGFFFHFLSVPRHVALRPRLAFRILKAQRALQQIQPDLVHCQDNMALALAACFSGYPRLFTLHGVKRDEAAKRTGWEYWSAQSDALIERYVHRHFDAFICISSYARQVVGAGETTFAIPNAVSSRFFQMRPTETAARRPRLLFAGVLAPLKRPADLLDAHVALREPFPDLETVFCGGVEDASYAAAMQRRVKHEKIDGVRFMGRVSQGELAHLLNATTVLVLPSSQENAPMVIAEAMAVGVPVVATRVGGVPDMVKHDETGLLYAAGDVDGLIASVRQLLEDPARYHRMAERSRQVAEATYSSASVARATVGVYQELLRQSTVAAEEVAHV